MFFIFIYCLSPSSAGSDCCASPGSPHCSPSSSPPGSNCSSSSRSSSGSNWFPVLLTSVFDVLFPCSPSCCGFADSCGCADNKGFFW